MTVDVRHGRHPYWALTTLFLAAFLIFTPKLAFAQSESEIGVIVWNDINQDGVRDTGEPGIANVTVNLYNATTNAFISSTTTDSLGLYLFSGLGAGDYRVQIAGATEFSPSGDLYGFVASPTGVDSDGDPSSNDVTLTVDGSAIAGSADFGFYAAGKLSLGNYVWLDENRDGDHQTPAEQEFDNGFSGVLINVYRDRNDNGILDAGDTLWTSTTTDGTGAYSVDVVDNLNYLVEVDSSNFDPSGPLEGMFYTNGNGSTYQDTNPQLAIVTTANVEDIDFGYAPIMSLGSYIWEDTNADGIQDASEVGVENATVALLVEDANNPGTFIPATTITGTQVLDQTTGPDGLYYFDNLPEGTYKIQVTPPSGYTYVPGVQQTNADNDVESDSNIASEPSSGVFESATITLSGTEPTEAGTFDGDDQDDALDANGNMTLDLGFIQYDWGDLPEPLYNTTNANGGPSHVIVPDLQIGAAVDGETDGQPNATATGDDTAGTPDDEDGVTLPSSITAGTTATFAVDVTNNTGSAATLYGFVDWNGDGDFDDLGETVSASVPDGTSAGSVDLDFSVPITATTGTDLGLRVRLSTDTGLTADGPATDGEVEDYLVQVVAQTPSLAIRKVLNTREPVRTGDPISFTIIITNTGPTTIAVLPLEDNYDTVYLGYTNASPNSDDNVGDGTINWSDLTASAPNGFDIDLAPDAVFEVTVNFTALADTALLPNSSTINNAAVDNAEDEAGNTPSPVDDDEPVEIYNPTGVYFAARSSVRNGAEVNLRWTTLDESQLAAFNVVRVNSDSTEVTLTASAIPAQFAGQPTGADYSFADTDLTGQSTVRYVLEVINMDGTITRLDLGRIHAGATAYLPLLER